MGKRAVAAWIAVTIGVVGTSAAHAGPWEDGMAAYNRGDYVPAVRIFRPLAQQGHVKAQALLGTMYRRGEGVARSAGRAFMWLSVAAGRGDQNARRDLDDLRRSMSAEDLAQARELALTCETTSLNACPY